MAGVSALWRMGMNNRFCKCRISERLGCGGWMYFCKARMKDGVAPRVRLADCRVCGLDKDKDFHANNGVAR
jgi:hypothetical protein